jgi:hypothetical protein
LFTAYFLFAGSVFVYIEALYRQPSSVAVLTGGNRGIGLEVLKKLLQCEITVILGMSFE